MEVITNTHKIFFAYNTMNLKLSINLIISILTLSDFSLTITKHKQTKNHLPRELATEYSK